jgi:pimeloyl-ACP methyl ester carboxylesterase
LTHVSDLGIFGRPILHAGRAEGIALGTFTASDGARIAWEETGKGRPILMLHGLMAHGGFFRSQAPLADCHRLITMDLRGHGQSSAFLSRSDGEDAVSLDRLAMDVAELAEALDLQGAVGVGWSLGASVLWQTLAGSAAPRFAGAVVIDMTPKVLNEGDWTLGLAADHVEARSAAFRDDFPAFATIAGPAIFAADDALGAWAAGEFARNDGAIMGAVWERLVEADLRPLLPLIDQPTLIVHGAKSPLYGPETARDLTERLPNARAAAFAHSGHAPHLEEPERFNALLTDFAATLPQLRQPQTA